MHNPSPDKKPGMTLDGIGLFFKEIKPGGSKAKHG
jgi:hypothetical protein